MSTTEKMSLERDHDSVGEKAGRGARPKRGRGGGDATMPLPDGRLFAGRNRGQTLAISKHYKVCKVCGRVFSSRRQYLMDTEPVRNNPEYPDGHMPAVGDDAHFYELRNCPCGATLVEKLSSDRDLSPMGRLRRAMFDDLMESYRLRHGMGREEARRKVMERYEAFFRSHVMAADRQSDQRGLDEDGMGGAEGEGGASRELAMLLSNRGVGRGPADNAVDEEIWERFGKVRALFVLDTSGFSRRTRSEGIVHFLSLIQDLRQRLGPILESHGVESYWFVADNAIAVFPDAESAVRAAVAVQRNVRIVNAGRNEVDRLEVCIGLGYGKVLVIGHEDVYGDEMNLASKLGEDVAGPGQILLTEAALEASSGLLEGVELTRRSVTVSAVELLYFELDAEKL